MRDDAAALLAEAGVEVGLSPAGRRAPRSRTLRQLAGIAVANGLPHARALAALTTVPARAFGVATAAPSSEATSPTSWCGPAIRSSCPPAPSA